MNGTLDDEYLKRTEDRQTDALYQAAMARVNAKRPAATTPAEFDMQPSDNTYPQRGRDIPPPGMADMSAGQSREGYYDEEKSKKAFGADPSASPDYNDRYLEWLQTLENDPPTALKTGAAPSSPGKAKVPEKRSELPFAVEEFKKQYGRDPITDSEMQRYYGGTGDPQPAGKQPGPNPKGTKADTRTPEQIQFDLIGANIAAATQAHVLGFDPKKIEVVSERKQFGVGGKTYDQAGEYDPQTDKVSLRLNPGITQAQRAAHTIPHEIMHANWQKWLQSEPFESGPWKGMDEKAWLEKLSKTGPAISSYAADWWRQAASKKPTKTDEIYNSTPEDARLNHMYQAANETLAEMARIKYNRKSSTGQFEKGDFTGKFPPEWEEVYHQVMRKQGPTFRPGVGPGSVDPPATPSGSYR